jgi:hypothetical protein
MRLFHVSETLGLTRFTPRPAADGTPKVWAIESRTLANYLLPRDCPRICLRPGKATDPAELALLDGAGAVIAIEAAWIDRVRAARLFIYEMPAHGFVLEDDTAGYWTSGDTVVPLDCIETADLPARIAEAGARLVVVDTLWPLHDRVCDSDLAFSMIRMRNATPRA